MNIREKLKRRMIKRKISGYLRYDGVEEGSIRDQIAHDVFSELESDLISRGNSREIAGLVNLVTATMCSANAIMISTRGGDTDARLKKEEKYKIKEISDFYSLPFEPLNEFKITPVNFVSGLIRMKMEGSTVFVEKHFKKKYKSKLEGLYSEWKGKYLNET